jgi:hypothetical protein
MHQALDLVFQDVTAALSEEGEILTVKRSSAAVAAMRGELPYADSKQFDRIHIDGPAYSIRLAQAFDTR